MTMIVHPAKQRGVSLVELLIAMALGLILLAGIGYIYWGSRQSYALQENLAGLQENAGFALEVLGQDVRMAGYIGCPNLGTGGNNVTPARRAADTSRIAFAAGKTLGLQSADVAPVMGVLDTALLRGTTSIATNQVANTDLLVVTRGSSQAFVLTAAPSGAGANTAIVLPSRSPLPSSPSGLNGAQQDALIISDCSQADIIHVAGFASAEAGDTITANVDLATAGRTYRAGAMVMGLETSAYFVRLRDPSKAEGLGNPRSLYRARWAPDASDGSGNPEVSELVENVQNMRVLYGVDNNDDGSADGYFRTVQFDGNAGSPTWNQVVSVRVSLLLRSASNRAASQPQPYSFDTDGDGDLDNVTPSDNHLYRVHTATLAIRNRASGG